MDEQTYQQQSVYQQQPMYQQPNGIPINNQEEPKQGLAIASFVLSLVGFNLLGLIFGIIALNKKQLRRAALAGTIISAVKLVLSIFIIMGIFAGALIPRIGAARDKANDVARESNIKTLATAMVAYSFDNDNKFPSSIENLDLRKYSVPAGNFNGTPLYEDTYNYLQLDNGDHFILYTDLSCIDCGNCDSNTVSKMTDFESISDYISNGSGGSFCFVY